MDIDRRRKPYAAVIFLHLFRGGSADPLEQILIPGAGKERRAGPGGRFHPCLRLNSKSCPSVRGHGIRDSVPVKIAPAERVGNSGVRLAPGQ